MKSLLTLIVLFHLLLAFNYSLESKNISNAAECFFGLPEVMDEHNNGNIANSCFVDMGTSYLVIDSGPTYQYAREAYTKIKQKKNLPISYVINTHIHDDHWLGNAYYKEQGAKIIGSIAFKSLPKLDITRMQRRIQKEAYQGTVQIFPSIFVSEENTLYFNGQKVYIKSVNHKAHTNSDLFVYIPSKKIVFVGDLIFNERIPSLRDGDITGWIEALEVIQSMDVKYIVGGHGTIVSKKAINFTYKYLKEMRKEILALQEEGEDIGSVVNKVKMLQYKTMPFYKMAHRQNVESAYRTLEWEDE